MKIRDKVTKTLLSPLVIFLITRGGDCLNSRHVDQDQRVQSISGDAEEDTDSFRAKRDTGQVEGQGRLIQDKAVSSAFNLNNSHLHLMVHWAGKGSSIVFCLARDQEIKDDSTSNVFISSDYGTSFTDISSKFLVTDKKASDPKEATINKFFHHPDDNCYYVFTDTKNKKIFVTRDCAETVSRVSVDFTPVHVEFDTKNLARFLIHDRNSDKMELYVTENYGETFNKGVDYIKSFFWHYEENFTELYVSRMEPSGKLNILSSRSFFSDPQDTSVVYTGAGEFEMKGDYLFIVKEDKDKPEHKRFFLAKTGERFVEARFSTSLDLLDFHVSEVSKDGQILVVVNHAGNQSNLYTSDRVSPHQAEFSLSLENIMYYKPGLTWRTSWLESIGAADEDNFADLYRVAGLRGIYIASQVAPGVGEAEIRPGNLTTLITFDGGAEWSKVQGPRNDTSGHPIPGCFDKLAKSKKCSLSSPDCNHLKETSCSLHMAQMMSRKYPITRSIPILTSSSAPGVILASGNVGQTLQHKTSVFLSADAGLSWHQVLQGNYYYNMGDHGGVIVAVKYFKTEGPTNILEYSTDEGLTWQQHQFYEKPLRVYGLITEPGENTTVFTMFGSKQDSNTGLIDWIIVKVDLAAVFTKNCSLLEDYKHWSPRGPHVKCIMGVRESYLRRSPKTNCYNGQDFTRPTLEDTCPCGHQDYQCDFGYKRAGSEYSSDCVQDPDFHDDVGYDQVPPVCPPDTFYTFSRGYVRVPGDKCEGGLASSYEPQKRACPVDLNNPRTFMLISQRKKIVKMDLSNPDAELEELPLIGISNVIAMDLDYETDCVFWADIEQDVIMKQCLNNVNGSSPEPLVISNLQSVEGMAYDHLSKLLYFVDGNKRAIEFVKVDENREGRMRKTVLDTQILGKPRGITLHPTDGFLFYSDWADKAACIGRSRLDGSDHKKILSVNDRNENILGWPNGLTIDFDAAPPRLYFVDAQKDFIASCRMDGTDFKKVYSSFETAHPFGVAVYKKFIVWNDWTRRAIYQVDKLNLNRGEGVKVIKDNIQGAMDLKIFSSRLLQKPEKYGCNNHLCTHVCINMPQDPLGYKCLCPDGMKLDSDSGHTCQCPDGQTTQQSGACLTLEGANCTSAQYQCHNKLCVSELWVCDGDNDCGDGSDEAHCDKHRECKDGEFRCKTGKCVPEHWRCDYEDDCGDGSDEAECPDMECDSATQFSCSNGQCINKSWVCDMEKDCQDGSDEEHCPEPGSVEGESQECSEETHLICEGQCFPLTWKCDGDTDCGDGSDEKDCDTQSKCHDWQFKCANGNCVFSNWECDGEADCHDGSDEHENCTIITAKHPAVPALPSPDFPRGECNEWMFKCESEQCIPYWWKCDGVSDCDDGSDERNCGAGRQGHVDKDGDEDIEPVAPSVQGCPRGKFQCNSGDCIWNAWVCDKEVDCGEGEDEDEDRCKAMVRCDEAEGKWQCQLSGKCINTTQVCDGRDDCDDGTDETKCFDKNSPVDQDTCPDGFTCDGGMTCLDWAHKCDGHLNCVDGSDEDVCEHWADQVLIQNLQVTGDHISHDSLTIKWWVEQGLDLEYKYSHSLHTHNVWSNVTDEWTKRPDQEFTFEGLQPATEYDLRVYMRNVATGLESRYLSIITASTGDWVPDCPKGVMASQRGDSVLVSWGWPPHPHGQLRSASVQVYSDTDNMIKEVEVPITSEMALLRPRMNVTVFGLEVGHSYKFVVLAANSDYLSESCSSVGLRLVTSVGTVHVTSPPGERSVDLAWDHHDPTLDPLTYTVCYTSANPLEPSTTCHNTSTPAFHITGLSPATRYNISVTARSSRSSASAPSTVVVNTAGQELPRPIIGSIDIVDVTSVKLSWKMPPGAEGYQFGIWHGVSLDQIVRSVPAVTKDTKVTIRNLQGCTDYIFVVAVLDIGKFGVGPMSDPIHISTNYSTSSPPRHVRSAPSEPFTILWDAPCDSMPRPVRYHLRFSVTNLYNDTTSQNSRVTLEPTANTSISYNMASMGVTPGAVYVVSISAGSGDPSPPVTMHGPPLEVPRQVYAHPVATEESEVRVSWAEVPEADHYDVVLSPDTSFTNTTCAITIPKVVETSFILNVKELAMNKCPEVQEFTVGVRATVVDPKSSQLLKSAFSRAGNTIVMVDIQEPGTITIPESSAVGTVVGVLIVMAMMGAGIGYYAYTNRRMRYRFRELIASHYNSATGHATVSHHGLMDDLDDDDESPIIRGFNDKEPLVT